MVNETNVVSNSQTNPLDLVDAQKVEISKVEPTNNHNGFVDSIVRTIAKVM
jgi:hypothetical protein